jgi:hypothetical protein
MPLSTAPHSFILRALALVALLAGLVAPLSAAPADDLMDALQIDDMLEIMREEGLSYGADLGEEMFPGGTSERWQALLGEIYDTEKMRAVMRRDFERMLDGTDAGPLIEFFSSDRGTEIIALELSARRAMIADDVEAAARDAFRSVDGTDDPRLEQLARFIEVNDLLEANVAGAMNASFQFYRGLVDGGGFDMTEADILKDVWAQETETRADTREWLHAFLLLAYRPLEDADLDAYIALSGSAEGRVLNRALFAGFNAMYDEISYALGLAAAQQMQGQDL